MSNYLTVQHSSMNLYGSASNSRTTNYNVLLLMSILVLRSTVSYRTWHWEYRNLYFAPEGHVEDQRNGKRRTVAF